MSDTVPAQQEIDVARNDVFLLPTRLIPGERDLEDDLSDVSLEEGVVDEVDVDEIQMMETRRLHGEKPGKPEKHSLELLDHLADRLGYDVDGRDRPDDALMDSLDEAACFSQFIFCGESHEVECIVLWDYFGGNNYDDLNVHAGDTVFVVAEEYQVRVVDDHTFMRLPFQWSLARWQTDRAVNPYMGLIPSHYVVSKEFYNEHPLLFRWPAWFFGNAEVHEVVHTLFSDHSALCPGLFGIFSPAWLNMDLDEPRCFLLMILVERDQKHDDGLEKLIEFERANYGIMADSINHIFGTMLAENKKKKKEKSVKMQHIEFISKIETTPFKPSVVPIHRSSLGHYEFMGDRYETLYDMVHYLATHRSALPHKLVYQRSSPLVVGRHVVPPPIRRFRKDLKCQPMVIEQWAATHFDEVTRRFESSEKTLFTTKTIFDSAKKQHEKVAHRLNLSAEEKEAASAYLRRVKTTEAAATKNKKKNPDEKPSQPIPMQETSIRIRSPFYVNFDRIVMEQTQLGKGAFGTVSKGFLEKTSKEMVPVAVKKLILKSNSKDERNLAFSEMEILEMLAHPNVVFYYGYSARGGKDCPQCLYLLFELMDTSLDKFLENYVDMISENERLDLLAQVCRGMSYLHTRTPPVVHGDLAARNVLLKKHPVYLKKYIAKVTDFGLAKPCRDELHTKYDDPTKIPFKWLPPEVLASRTLSLKTDVWAFGIVCFEVCDKMAEPYGAIVPQPAVYQYLNDGYRHEIGPHMSPTIYEISLDCMRKQPVDRPSFGELVDRLLECIIEMDGEDDVKWKAREKLIAEKNRKDRIKKGHGKLLTDDL